MYSIGQFSLITRLPVKTLRYYDEIGLLKPARVEEATGYRYYGTEEVAAAEMIVLFRDLDFSLAEIAELTEMARNGEMGSLAVRLRRQERVVADRRDRYESLLARLRSFAGEVEKEAVMEKFEVEERQLEPELVLTLRKTGRYEELGPLFEALMEFAMENGLAPAGPPIYVCLDQEYKAEAADLEAALPVQGELDEARRVTGGAEGGFDAKMLEGGRALVTIHQGPYDEVGPAYQAVMDEAARRGLRLSGPTREVYLNDPSALPEEEYLTEIQAPVEQVR